MKRIFASLVTALALAGSAHAQAPLDCDAELRQLRFLVQLYQAGRTSTEFEVARLQVLTQNLQRELDRLRQAVQPPGGKK